jgi:single-strand DNA-binding protein
MSRTLNKVMLIGNVGREPELKFTPSGIPVTSFRLATSETWKDRDGVLQEHTDWHTIVAWRGLAEVINKLVGKGSRIYIEGRIQTRNFEDRNGNRRHVVEVLADQMLLLDNRKDSDNIADDDDDYQSDDDYDFGTDSRFEGRPRSGGIPF